MQFYLFRKPWKETMRRGRYSWGGGHCPLQWVPPWSGLPGISTTCSIFCPRSSDWELFSKANDWSVKKQTDKSRHEDDPVPSKTCHLCVLTCVCVFPTAALTISISILCLRHLISYSSSRLTSATDSTFDTWDSTSGSTTDTMSGPFHSEMEAPGGRTVGNMALMPLR